MASEENDQEKTEEATQTRREDFRKKGQVAQSRELGSTLFILSAALGIFLLSQFFFSQVYNLFHLSMGLDLVQVS